MHDNGAFKRGKGGGFVFFTLAGLALPISAEESLVSQEMRSIQSRVQQLRRARPLPASA